MEKRVVVFLVTSMVILFFYMIVIDRMGFLPNVPAPKGSEAETTSAPQQDNTGTGPAPIVPATADKTQAVPAAQQVPAVVAADAGETNVVIENELYRAVLSNKGGVVKEWKLKKYQENKKGLPVSLFKVNPGEDMVYPLSFSADAAGTEAGYFKTAIFNQRGGSAKLNDSNKSATLVYSLRDSKTDRWVRKTLVFYHDSYKVDVSIETGGFTDGYSVSLGSNFGIADWGSSNYISFVGPVSMTQQERTRHKLKDITDGQQVSGETDWVSIQDKYFISALIPNEPIDDFLISKKGDKNVSVTLKFEGGAPNNKLLLFAGPKKLAILKEVGLDSNVDFGWFIFGSWSLVWLMARPLFSMIQIIYSLTHNYGVSIILVTILVKVVLFPLTHKSFKSMRAMKSIQPQVAALQAKYKKDKERLNRELIELYRVNKVNPLGGCLPILLQMPVFVALYNILFTSIEFRHAPFVLWISDLSVKDPMYVLPVIMGATMFLQQKMQPAQDASQARMMMFMPAVFTFMFLNFPSGLVLYWMTNNILTVSQQYITEKLATGG